MLTLIALAGCLFTGAVDTEVEWNGFWTYSHCERDGKAVPHKDCGQDHSIAMPGFIVGDGHYQFFPPIGGGLNPPGYKPYDRGSFAIDARKTPHQIDFIPDEPGAPRRLGVYRLEGDTLRLRFGRSGERRPGTSGKATIDAVYTREPGATVLLGSDDKLVVIRPDLVAPMKAGVYQPLGMSPPVHPALYIEAARRLYRKGDHVRAAMCLKGAEDDRELLSDEDRKTLDEFRVLMPREEPNAAVEGFEPEWNGLWTHAFCERDRKALPHKNCAPSHDHARHTLLVVDGHFRFSPLLGGGFDSEGGWKSYLGSFSVDATRTPHEIDFFPSVSGGLRMKGIYRLDGATLRLCLGRPGEPRPRAFGSGLLEEVWTRDLDAKVVMGKDRNLVALRPDDFTPKRSTVSSRKDDPPAPPSRYLDAAVELYAEGHLDQANVYLRAAQRYRGLLSKTEKKTLDEYRELIPRVETSR